MSTTVRPALMLTERDLAVIGWLAALGAASANDVATRFGVRLEDTYRRLNRLASIGLVRPRRVMYRRPGLYVATALGVRAVGLERVRPFRLGPGNFQHAAEVARVAAALGRAGTAYVEPERSLRARERDEDRLLGSVALARGALHTPDLLATRGRKRLAIEVELTVKSPARLRSICTAYARARHLDGVFYLASPAAARAVLRAAQAAAAEDRVRVLALHATAEVAHALRA